MASLMLFLSVVFSKVPPVLYNLPASRPPLLWQAQCCYPLYYEEYSNPDGHPPSCYKAMCISHSVINIFRINSIIHFCIFKISAMPIPFGVTVGKARGAEAEQQAHGRDGGRGDPPARRDGATALGLRRRSLGHAPAPVPPVSREGRPARRRAPSSPRSGLCGHSRHASMARSIRFGPRPVRPAAGAARGHGETAGPDQGRGERAGIPR